MHTSLCFICSNDHASRKHVASASVGPTHRRAAQSSGPACGLAQRSVFSSRGSVACASFGGGNRLGDNLVYEAERSDETGKKLAVLLGAARAARMSPDVFKLKLAELRVLLPSISADRLLQLDRNLLAQLAGDTAGVARRLVGLTELFPTANIPRLVAKRPSIVLQKDFEQVPAARAALAELFPDADIDKLVAEQPLLLVEDVKEAIESLRRLMPGTDPLQTLKHNPHMLVSVMSNRKLSIW